MRVLFSTASPAGYMQPPLLGDEQIDCGPDWPDDRAADGRIRSLTTPVGRYDLAAVAARLPAAQAPDLVVCLVDASWRNLPRNLAAFKCPRVLLVADTHHLGSPVVGMVRYLAAEPYDRIVLLYDRHHAAFFRALGFRNLFWFPGLTFPHSDATVRAARQPGARSRRIAFVGQAGKFHPRRTRLLAALAARRLPVAPQALPQAQALGFYGASLLGFNASLNGDLNLRIFEILAAGGALLTDRLAPESGLARLLTDGRELLTYGTADELVERAEHALAHPAETKAMGAAGARWFDTHFGAARRRAAFRALAFDGTPVAEFDFAPEETARVFFDGRPDRLLRSLIAYETVQELHRTQETVDVSLDATVPADFDQMCATLPRVKCGRSPGNEAADLAVFGRTHAAKALAARASRLWCWDAGEGDAAKLARAFQPEGYGLASGEGAMLVRAKATAATAESDEAKAALWLELARDLQARGELGEALDALRAGLQADQTWIEGWVMCAEVAHRLGSADLAREAAGRAREIAPDDTRVLAYL